MVNNTMKNRLFILFVLLFSGINLCAQFKSHEYYFSATYSGYMTPAINRESYDDTYFFPQFNKTRLFDLTLGKRFDYFSAGLTYTSMDFINWNHQEANNFGIGSNLIDEPNTSTSEINSAIGEVSIIPINNSFFSLQLTAGAGLAISNHSIWIGDLVLSQPKTLFHVNKKEANPIVKSSVSISVKVYKNLNFNTKASLFYIKLNKGYYYPDRSVTPFALSFGLSYKLIIDKLYFLK